MSVVISVENVSKSYRLGTIGGGTLKEDLNRLWARARGKADPSSKIGEERHARLMGEEFWALKDISFAVQRGEVLGVIGRNGAGKSTLLKILSQVTAPTSGEIKIKGRIASLLEVGTGFHPDLTGRENVFLNGAILGMTKQEIRRKFDEIIEFSGIQAFVDTPVKRYSSGMYVRLAFAVAAHLEPEILIVDEVLAVGDSEFQEKCIGKMKDVSINEGRTVLFVSHNLAAVKSLTRSSILMDQGRIMKHAKTDEIIESYFALPSGERLGRSAIVKGRGRHATIKQVTLLDELGRPTNLYIPGTVFQLSLMLSTDGASGISIELFLKDAKDMRLAFASLHQFHGLSLPAGPGSYVCKIKLQPLPIAAGLYRLDAATSVVNAAWDHEATSVLTFNVPFSNPNARPWNFQQSDGYGAYAWLIRDTPEFIVASN